MSVFREFPEDPGFGVVPDDDVEVSIEELGEAAVAAALEDPFTLEAPPSAPIPFGRTWAFDHDAGRFVRFGSTPAEVSGTRALAEWLGACLKTAAGRHPALDPGFGLENPHVVIGAEDVAEASADFEEQVRAAFTRHDRVLAVENVVMTPHFDLGVVHVESLDVVTDEDEPISLRNSTVTLEV